MKTKIKEFINKYKDLIKGFGLVLLIGAFTYVIVQQNEYTQKQEFERVNKLAEQREALATKQRDEARLKAEQASIRLAQVEGKLSQQNLMLDKLYNSYSQSLNQLKQLQNEKNYIPNNVSISEQSLFLSKYKYQPYESK